MKSIILIAACLQLLLLSCSGQTDKQEAPQKTQLADSIVIGFKDASVPPAYHRSYEMLFTPNQARYRLYAYDSTLLIQDTVFSKAQFDELAALFVQLGIKKGRPNGLTKGCAGGTSRYVQEFAAGKAMLNGSIYYCDNKSDGNIDGNLAELCKAAKKYFSKAVDTDRDNN
jgi:hypothetical protein